MSDADGDLDPKKLAADASGATDAGEAAADAGEAMSDAEASYPAGGDDGDGSNPLAALFETDPDMNPDAIQGPAWVGELVVGGRKFLNGLGISTGEATDGDPAIANFSRAFIGYAEANGIDLPLVGGRGGSSDDDDDGPGVTVNAE